MRKEKIGIPGIFFILFGASMFLNRIIGRGTGSPTTTDIIKYIVGGLSLIFGLFISSKEIFKRPNS